jgi:hypothetical protein
MAGKTRRTGKPVTTKGGTMIDSNQNEFAGAIPDSGSPASWKWLIERVPTSGLAILDDWMTDQLLELEASCEDWMTPKSRILAMQKELRDSRS